MIQKKICMVGSYGVGKTSLVRRYVESVFDERYQTTIGVKIDKKVLHVEGIELSLVIWDLAGEDETEKLRRSHLRGASGCILVADGCRAATLACAAALSAQVEAELGPVPRVLAVNKADLRDRWEFSLEEAGPAIGAAVPVIQTSARTGDGVESMFAALAVRMLRYPSEG